MFETRLKYFYKKIGVFLSNYKLSLISFALILLLIVLIWAGYQRFIKGEPWSDWTKLEAKSLWEWLELLIVPIILALGAIWFNRQQKSRELEIEAERRKQELGIELDRQREEALQNYLARMSLLLIDKGLRKSEIRDETRYIARSQTLTTLRMLDPIRKGLLMSFLQEANLIDIDEGAIVNLRKADLSKIDMAGSSLNLADLYEVNLSEANLKGVDLDCSNISKSDLSKADLSETTLITTKLSKANLYMATLTKAYLSSVDLSGANLQKADFSGATLYNTNLSEANLTDAILIGTRYAKNTVWPDGFDLNGKGTVFFETTGV